MKPSKRALYWRIGTLACVVFLLEASSSAWAQMAIQIPTLQVCNRTEVSGEATVMIASRAGTSGGTTYDGTFHVKIELRCDPKGKGFPEGDLVVSDISMTDSTLQKQFVATTFEQVSSAGKHSPMAFVNGRCSWHEQPCRFWMLLADNQQRTPDVIGFFVVDPQGVRLGYGTGPVKEGDIVVKPY